MKGSPMLWSLAQQVGRQASSYVVFAVLAILLKPDDFGVIALASVWLAWMNMFAELGFSAAIIQREQIEPGHLSSTFALNLALGALFCLLGIAGSWLVAWTFHTPAVQPVMAALSLSFVINALSITQVALAQREFRFRSLAIRDITSSLAGGAVGIVMALRGAGVWSLVAQQLTSGLVGAITLWRLSPWRPRLREVSRAYLGDLWPYGSKIVAFTLFKFVAQNVDQLVIGYLLGPVALGTYVFASKVMLTPLAALRGAFGAYLFPRFARMQKDLAAVSEGYLFFVRAITACIAPIVAGAAVASPVLIPWLFGAKWNGAIPVIQVLAVVAVAQAFMTPLGELMKALNRPMWMLWWSVGLTIVTVAAIAAGAPFGIFGVAAGLAAAHLVALPAVFALIRRLIPMTLASMTKAAAGPLAAAGALAAATYLVLDVTHAVPLVRLGLALGAGTAAYIGVLHVTDPGLVRLARERMARTPRDLPA